MRTSSAPRHTGLTTLMLDDSTGPKPAVICTSKYTLGFKEQLAKLCVMLGPNCEVIPLCCREDNHMMLNDFGSGVPIKFRTSSPLMPLVLLMITLMKLYIRSFSVPGRTKPFARGVGDFANEGRPEQLQEGMRRLKPMLLMRVAAKNAWDAFRAMKQLAALASQSFRMLCICMEDPDDPDEDPDEHPDEDESFAGAGEDPDEEPDDDPDDDPADGQ